MAKGKHVWFEFEMLRSKAFVSLKTASAHIILTEFYCRRQFERKSPRSRIFNFINNDEIVFTYEDAYKRYGMSSNTFRRAIDELRNKGFIDIASSGQGIRKITTFYSIVDRWRLYGTDEYVPPKPRRKGPINRGFQKGNKLGKNSC